ncbi:tyrosine--tRNA ligase, chloroplastic/mitochondrial [Magnolia sinica]|uniref:tyrosine--tRNA ligase, chloroplastic/mitochondrial n=1 Tax=Magnolia sinica TaxID=86752 RepID=UPI002658B119|nr:tyrosine--tRNA ligase, chloroplastic/mitochondrial [Magnolia sinica]
MAAAANTRTFLLFSTPNKLFSFSPSTPSKTLPKPFFLPLVKSLHSSQTPLKSNPPISKSIHRSNVIDILQQRGLIESITSDNLRQASSNPAVRPLKVYCGFDPTAESLHLGNLIGIIVLSWFRRCGHRTVALIGGATARIGDPSGKSLERPELDVETVERNSAGIEDTVRRILGRSDGAVGYGKDRILDAGSEENAVSNLNFAENANLDVDSEENVISDAGSEENAVSNSGSAKNANSNVGSEENAISDLGFEKNTNSYAGSGDSFVILNNYDWWKGRNLLDFLKEEGRFARVGVMISKESVKRRLASEEGLSFTEFTYQLLQGSDFLHLFKNEGVNVQIGGSDQWGNITAGTELIRKKLQIEGAYGLTFPLLLKSDGTKFGKSEGGAIWLSPSMLSPYKFYQYFFSVPDSDIVRFLKILTFLSLEEIVELEEGMKCPGYVQNLAQRRLAEEVTRFVHGVDGLMEALKATEALRPGAETQLDWKTIEEIAEDVPSCSLAYDQVLNASLVDLSVSAGLLGSKSAARRMVKQGGLYLNNKRVDSEEKTIEADDFVDGKVLLLSAGKKNKIVVRIS